VSIEPHGATKAAATALFGKGRGGARIALLTLVSLWALVWALAWTLAFTANSAVAKEPVGTSGSVPKALAVETFLADIARSVAGDRLVVESLLPVGVDPHGFEPTPKDAKKVDACDILIVNGAGFEEFLNKLLANVGGKRSVIVAAAGLAPRAARPDEEGGHEGQAGGRRETDPHFWLDPNYVIKYVQNIRDGLVSADPGGAPDYARNAESYIVKLKALDAWIRGLVVQVPEKDRLLVTNHESLGYFADRYGFKIVGTIVPSVSTGASPSAKQLAAIIDVIKKTGARAIFLETGTDPKLARQIARETGIKVVEGLYTHSVSGPGGDAPTYIDMIRFDTRAVVGALR
jgi:ABC-type Zn uptake system ZnuABC Zn-binding protein ZnuA